MSKTIYVGNLPLDVSGAHVRRLFDEAGWVILALELPTNPRTGRSRGFAYVEMEEGDAEEAIVSLTGRSYKGRILKVSEATSRSKRQQRTRGIQRW